MINYLKAILVGLCASSQPTIEVPLTLNNACYKTLTEYWQQTAYEQTKQQQKASASNLPFTQTSAHLLFGITDAGKQSITTLLERYKNEHGTSINPLEAMTPALVKECESNQYNFRVLYTSEQPQFYAAHYIDTQCMKLYQECIKDTSITNNHLLLLRQPCTEQINEDSDTQKQKRLDFLQHGAQGHDNRTYNQRYLLSCNASILGNIADWKECSFRYMLQKHRARTGDSVTLSLNNIFAQYTELQNVLMAHMQELQNTIDTLVNNTTSGILLQLIFKSDDLLKKCCYSSCAGGSKYPLYINNKAVSDPIAILDTYCTQPNTISKLDEVQFRLILTSDLLLDITNPEIHTNLEMYPHCLDTEVLDSFHEQVQQCMLRIKDAYFNTTESLHAQPLLL